MQTWTEEDWIGAVDHILATLSSRKRHLCIEHGGWRVHGLFVPLEVPSQNKTDRAHWTHRRRHSIECGIHLRACGPPEIGTRLHVHAVRRRKIRDRANLIGGCKGMVDAVVRAGWIADDADDQVEIIYSQETGRPARTVFIVGRRVTD